METATETTETLEAFTHRMSEVEFKDQFIVGRAYQGNTRSIYNFEGQQCLLESCDFRNLGDLKRPATPAQMYYVACANPHDYWDLCQLIYGKGRAKKIAKHYGAFDIYEAPYAKEEVKWFTLLFREFEDLMKMVYDIHTGKYFELWGQEEKKEYVNCF